MGYFSGYGSTTSAGIGNGANFNTIRFTSSTLLPLRDFEVTGPTGAPLAPPIPEVGTR